MLPDSKIFFDALTYAMEQQRLHGPIDRSQIWSASNQCSVIHFSWFVVIGGGLQMGDCSNTLGYSLISCSMCS